MPHGKSQLGHMDQFKTLKIWTIEIINFIKNIIYLQIFKVHYLCHVAIMGW